MSKALIEDMANMEDISVSMGDFLKKPYSKSMQQRINWAFAVALYHIIGWILKQKKSDGQF